jgi:hypothetical protein
MNVRKLILNLGSGPKIEVEKLFSNSSVKTRNREMQSEYTSLLNLDAAIF